MLCILVFLRFFICFLLYFVSPGPQLHTMHPGSPETFVAYLWFKQGSEYKSVKRN